MHLAGTSNFNDSSSGQMVDFLLENLVFCDLLAWRETQYPAPDILYWRTIQGQEVDIVIESAAGLIPIEIKRTARPRLRDITGLSAFLKDYPKTAMHGILLHSGETVERLADKIWAVPLTAALGINSL